MRKNGKTSTRCYGNSDASLQSGILIISILWITGLEFSNEGSLFLNSLEFKCSHVNVFFM